MKRKLATKTGKIGKGVPFGSEVNYKIGQTILEPQNKDSFKRFVFFTLRNCHTKQKT